MKFSEMKYERPDIKEVISKFIEYMGSFKNAKNFEDEDVSLKKINILMSEYQSMNMMAYINYSSDTGNEKYSNEQDFFNDSNPVFENYKIDYYKILLKSKFRVQLEKKYGKQLFRTAELSIKSCILEITEDLQKENHLKSEYTKLVASAKIMFAGKVRNLQGLAPFMEDKHRQLRKQAYDAFWKFFSDYAGTLDELFDKLVFLRNEMALKMEFENFKGLGYARMKRDGYNEERVNEFRNNIKKYIVPLSKKLREKQRKRIGLDKLMQYDHSLQFNSGNPQPKGNSEWIMNNGKIMYDELSPETSEFYDFMIKNELMDVYSRKGKAVGAFCDFIPKYKAPYIFTNMNGTNDDVSILTHEAGHAFQSYMGRNFNIMEYFYPTMEACEIHSMSMEFLTYPWMNLFFKEDTEKFKYLHLVDAINSLPYLVMIDDFQHWVYENHSATPEERKSAWSEMEKIYMPDLDYDDNEYLKQGGRWQRISHIYEDPFYSIDYGLAQICAFQFWSKAIHHGNGQFESVLKDYIKLCSAGGSMSFLELVKYANLESPFEENVIKKLANEIETYLDSIDDKAF